jgi:hypothetical protein
MVTSPAATPLLYRLLDRHHQSRFKADLLMVAHQTTLTARITLKMVHVLPTYNQQAWDAATANPKQDHELQQDKPASTSHSLLPRSTSHMPDTNQHGLPTCQIPTSKSMHQT